METRDSRRVLKTRSSRRRACICALIVTLIEPPIFSLVKTMCIIPMIFEQTKQTPYNRDTQARTKEEYFSKL